MKLVSRSAALVLLAVLCIAYLSRLEPQGDTILLVHDVDLMIGAIKAETPTGFGGQFALLQQIPAIVLKLLGLSDSSTVTSLAVLNLLAFAGLLARTWFGARKKSRPVVCWLLIVLLSGPLLWYARTSFGEMLAAFFTVSFAVRCCEDRSESGIYLDGFLAGISKETAFIFLVVLGLAGSSCNSRVWTNPAGRRHRVRSVIAVALLSAATNVTFNYVRFGTVSNRVYANRAFTVSFSDQASFFAGLWLSPNGGVLFFWPAFCLLLIASIWAAKSSWRLARDETARMAALGPVLGITAAMFGLTVGLSRWAFPMGWICWGSRFLVPWIPAFTYVLVAAYSEQLDEVLRRATSSLWRAWMLTGVLTLIAVPQFAVLFKPQIIPNFFAPDSAFPIAAIIQQDRDYYLRFIHYLLWRKLSPWREAYAIVPVCAAVLTLGCSVALSWLYALCFYQARRQRRPS